MRWIEVATRVDNEAVEAVAEVFQRFAHGGVVIEYSSEPGPGVTWDEAPVIPPGEPVTVRGYLPKTRTGVRKRKMLEEALWHLGSIWPVPQPVAREVRDEDWATAWKEHFFAHRIGQRLIVKPSWREFSAGPDDLVITLDPGMAFGTGLHPTTRLCLVALEKYLRRGARVLDVGTGSGILAIAAARLGAQSVLAVDVDEVAVEAARANVTANGLEGVIDVRLGSADDVSSEHDLVLANIIARVIVDLASDLVARTAPDGLLVASGILDLKLPEVVAALPLEVVETMAETDWRAVVARRPR